MVEAHEAIEQWDCVGVSSSRDKERYEQRAVKSSCLLLLFQILQMTWLQTMDRHLCERFLHSLILLIFMYASTCLTQSRT